MPGRAGFGWALCRAPDGRRLCPIPIRGVIVDVVGSPRPGSNALFAFVPHLVDCVALLIIGCVVAKIVAEDHAGQAGAHPDQEDLR